MLGPATGLMMCPECHMTFSSYAMYHKHRDKFCVGKPTRHFLRQSPSPKKSYQDMSTTGHYDQLTVIHDERSDTPESQWDSRSSRLKNLQYQMKGMQLLDTNNHRNEKIPSPNSSMATTRTSLASSNSSISIDVASDDEEPSPRRHGDQSTRQQHLQARVDAHGRNLAEYKSKSRALEQKKNEIDKRLQELNGTDWAFPNILNELKLQEARNRRVLGELKDEMAEHPDARPFTSNESLMAEIQALRLSYLREGGNNPLILKQISQMEMEAGTSSTKHWKEKNKRRKLKEDDEFDKVTTMDQQIVAYDLENHRLQNELVHLKETNKDSVQKAPAESENISRLNHEIEQRQQDYLRQLADLEHEMEVTKQQARLERLKREMQTVEENVKPPGGNQVQPSPRLNPQMQPAEVPALIQNQYNPSTMVDADPLQPTVYDPNGGFVVFYDFVTGMDMSVQSVRLVVGLYNNIAQYGEPTVLPTVYCEGNQSYVGQHSNMAVIGAKQPVPRCPPQQDLHLVIELQSSAQGGRLSTRAWGRVPLFDPMARLVSGRWRVLLRMPPIRPNIPPHELHALPQYGSVEVFIRLVNVRDDDVQSMANVTGQNSHLYQYPPQVHAGYSVAPTQPYAPPPLSASTASHTITPRRHTQDRPEEEPFNLQEQPKSVGFQVDRVRNAESGEGKVRLTAYYHSTGKVVQSGTSPVTCSTTPVHSNFRHHYHMFGQQEALFHDVEMTNDMVLVARIYLRKRVSQTNVDGSRTDTSIGAEQQSSLLDEEALVAWASMPLVKTSAKLNQDHNVIDINTGILQLDLYEPPVPEIHHIPMQPQFKARDWRPYGTDSTLRIHVFLGVPRPGSLTPSEVSDDEEEAITKEAWIHLERDKPPTVPFNSNDGFDLYLDGCRHLPDNMTISRVAARVLDRKYERVGKDITCNGTLESDIFNPVYEERVEFREPNMSPTSTLLLKLYTVDRFYKKLCCTGYAALNIFVETGTYRQPESDAGGIQISLNEGAHQLRLYAKGPNGIDPLSESCFLDSGARVVPCASVLVRLVRTPAGPNGIPLEADKVPQADWGQLGLWNPRPHYAEKVYSSMKCKPSRVEMRLFPSLIARSRVSAREVIHLIGDPNTARKVKSEEEASQFVKDNLQRIIDDIPIDIDLTFITQYNPEWGIKFSLDGALNLTWSNFTHAHFCLNPPGAFYMGQPQGSFDKLAFSKLLDLDSTNKKPAWRDGFIHFKNRSYHKFLTLIIHLQEISVSVSASSYKYGLIDQAWTAVQIFQEGYANTDIYQLPLFIGSPNPNILRQISREPFLEWMNRSWKSGQIKPADYSSVFVRLADGRRDDELPDSVNNKQMVQINTDHLPEEIEANYLAAPSGRTLRSLIPPGREPHDFTAKLATKFKSLVYKLYEDGNLTNR